MQVLTNIWSVLFFPVPFVLIGMSQRENMFFCKLKWMCVSLGDHIESCDSPVTSLLESQQVQAAISNKTPSSSSPCHASADKAMMNGVHTVNHLKCELHNCCLELTLILYLIFWMEEELRSVTLHLILQRKKVLWEFGNKAQKFNIHVSSFITSRQSDTSDTKKNTKHENRKH